MAQPNWSYLDGENPARMRADRFGAKARMAEKLPTFKQAADAAGDAARRFGAKVPMGTLKTVGSTVGRLAVPGVGGALAVGAEALDTMEVAADPSTSKLDVATRAAEGVSRLSSAGAGAALGAAGGSAFGPIGTVVGGGLGAVAGYAAPNAVFAVRDWWRNRNQPAAPVAAAAPTAAVPAAPAATGGSTEVGGMPGIRVSRGEDGLPVFTGPGGAVLPTINEGGAFRRAPAEPAAPAVVPGNTRGTGVITREDGTTIQVGQGAVPAAPRGADGSVGSYVGALMNQRQRGLTEERNLAKRKLEVDAIGKGATAAAAAAKAQQDAFTTQAAQEHLRRNPGDYAGAAAVAAGRVLPRDTFSVPFPPLSETGPVTVLNKGTGALEKRQPAQYVTEANINASMAARRMTRAQAIEAYRAQGMDVSRIKP